MAVAADSGQEALAASSQGLQPLSVIMSAAACNMEWKHTRGLCGTELNDVVLEFFSVSDKMKMIAKLLDN